MSKRGARRTILIIDDDRLFCDATREYLEQPDRTVMAVHIGGEGVEFCKSQRVDVVLLDQNLPDTEGHGLCPEILEHNEQCKIIFITAHPSFDSAVEALRAGAFDYLSKPFEPEALSLSVDQAIRTLALEDVEQLAQYQSHQERLRNVLVGSDGGLAEIARLVTLAGSADAPVLITGETGTGKNVAAKAIHYASSRENKPFIKVNCAALPENLIEAELFGHERGAFTGATVSRRGMFEMAAGGTLFLDEIGEMPIHLQTKLLSAIEDKEIRRLGSERTRYVDVHIIAATAANLEEVLDDSFRRDLYYRLSVMRIHMPPLREHTEDIPAFCDYFLTELCGAQRPKIVESDLEHLEHYHWPGNVRELRNILERASIVQRGGPLEPSKILGNGIGRAPRREDRSGNGYVLRPLEEVEKEHLRLTLEQLDHNYTHSAKALGIAISTLKRKVRKYGLQRW